MSSATIICNMLFFYNVASTIKGVMVSSSISFIFRKYITINVVLTGFVNVIVIVSWLSRVNDN